MQVHRDRRRDDVRATNDAVPPSGRVLRPFGSVAVAGRATWPAAAPAPWQTLAQRDPGHRGSRIQALGRSTNTPARVKQRLCVTDLDCM